MLVRSFKRVLYSILGTRRLIGSFKYILSGRTNTLRPLTLVGADLPNLGALAPTHFLIGNQVTAIPSIVGVNDFDHRTLKPCHVGHVPALNRRSK